MRKWLFVFLFVCLLISGLYFWWGLTGVQPLQEKVLKFAEVIKALTGSRSEIVFRPLPVDDPKQRQPDITRARTLLGWEPTVGLEAGLRQTIDYFRDTV